MTAILNMISVASSFLFGVGAIYVLLNVTLGKLKFFKSKVEWYGFQVKDFAFIVIAACVILTFTSLVRPY
jgi:hypothetical protein